jgi:vacuolar-type H+-ATPase subunit I/STV1
MKRSELKQLIREAIEETHSDLSQDGKGLNINPIIHPDDMKEAKKEKEGVHLSDDVEDEVGSFYIVEKPGTKSTVEDIVVECSDIAYFANQVRGGLKLEDIKGVFVKEAKAKKLANKLIKERDDKREEVKKAAEAYKKMKDETLAKVQEYMKNKKATKDVVDELKDLTDK